MKGSQLTIFFILTGAASAYSYAFELTRALRMRKHLFALSSSAFFDLDPISKLNLDKVHYCAENVGKCSIEEMEEMEKALHTERIQHSAVGFPLDPIEELDHRLLEEELRTQLALLKNEMTSLPSREYSTMIAQSIIAGDHKKGSVGSTIKKAPLNSFFSQGRDLFLIPFDIAEMLMYIVALMLLFFLPDVLHT